VLTEGMIKARDKALELLEKIKVSRGMTIIRMEIIK
jgi:hypothetical protein